MAALLAAAPRADALGIKAAEGPRLSAADAGRAAAGVREFFAAPFDASNLVKALAPLRGLDFSQPEVLAGLEPLAREVRAAADRLAESVVSAPMDRSMGEAAKLSLLDDLFGPLLAEDQKARVRRTHEACSAGLDNYHRDALRRKFNDVLRQWNVQAEEDALLEAEDPISRAKRAVRLRNADPVSAKRNGLSAGQRVRVLRPDLLPWEKRYFFNRGRVFRVAGFKKSASGTYDRVRVSGFGDE
ncbi:MAG: hypothetical protein PHF00_05240, partial [Elusimicrobia bacterium]|nr:hypothetical protein [Elusimicrobiota bacterium]